MDISQASVISTELQSFSAAMFSKFAPDSLMWNNMTAESDHTKCLTVQMSGRLLINLSN